MLFSFLHIYVLDRAVLLIVLSVKPPLYLSNKNKQVTLSPYLIGVYICDPSTPNIGRNLLYEAGPNFHLVPASLIASSRSVRPMQT